jgi:hypothetical protein
MNKFGGKNWLISIQEHGTHHSKRIIKNAARDYVNHYHIPLRRCFSNRRKDYHHVFDPEGFLPLQADCLLNVKENDKLFIVAHANENVVGGFNAGELANQLHTWGLRNVGLVTFKACNVGTREFLQDFVNAAATKAIVIGWAKGYRGECKTLFTDDDDNVIARPRYRVFGGQQPEVGKWPILTGDNRIKIVRGRLNPFTEEYVRYT